MWREEKKRQVHRKSQQVRRNNQYSGSKVSSNTNVTRGVRFEFVNSEMMNTWSTCQPPIWVRWFSRMTSHQTTIIGSDEPIGVTDRQTPYVGFRSRRQVPHDSTAVPRQQGFWWWKSQWNEGFRTVKCRFQTSRSHPARRWWASELSICHPKKIRDWNSRFTDYCIDKWKSVDSRLFIASDPLRTHIFLRYCTFQNHSWRSPIHPPLRWVLADRRHVPPTDHALSMW